MTKKSLIHREKKRQKLEQKYHLIRRSSKKEISKVSSLSENGKFMESYNPHHKIAHPNVFIDVAFRPKDRELTIETLDYPDTYFVKWFTHICFRRQQDQVGKD